MDEETKNKLTSNDGVLIELNDYDVKVVFDEGNRFSIRALFYKKGKDRSNNHINQFSDEDIDELLQDLKDLSDWRHFRRLKNKLHK